MSVNHPSRNWRRSWTWDTAASTATHCTGVAVKFEAKGETGWDGELLPTTAQYLGSLDPRRIARLMREAGDYATEQIGNGKIWDDEAKPLDNETLPSNGEP